jgi:hypothetical protein
VRGFELFSSEGPPFRYPEAKHRNIELKPVGLLSRHFSNYLIAQFVDLTLKLLDG